MIEEVTTIKVDGFVNAMAMSPRLLVAGTGREPKLGRWWCMKGNKNKVHIMRFPADLSDARATPGSGSGSGSGSEESESESESKSESESD